MVLQNDGAAKRVDVISGAIVDTLVVVTGNLKAGDRIQMANTNGFDAPNPFSGGE
jgi:hypothetical protein